jgi:PIN domain
MKELHALVDFENVQPTLDELAKLALGFTDVWLFHGPHQAKQAQQLADLHSRVTQVPRSGKGKNALDFHLSFYLGYVAAKHPLAELVVVANDKGYDPMIDHARLLGFVVKRVGYKVKTTRVSIAVPAKKVMAVKMPVPVKKAVTRAEPVNAVARKVSAGKAATPNAPSKNAVTEKVASRKTATKDVAHGRLPRKGSVQAKGKSIARAPAAKVSPENKVLVRVQKGLDKMGDKAPTNLRPFLRLIGAQLGHGTTAEQIDALVAKLEKAGAVRIVGDTVAYP